MPKVKLIHHTGQGTDDPVGSAARLLAYTKNTRMNMTPDGFEEFLNKDHREVHDEIKYMATTIQSSWEFVDVIFAINDVSRATAQQITRTRHATFAMQSQRVTNMKDVNWTTPQLDFEDDGDNEGHFDAVMEQAIDEYSLLVDRGVSLEDARDVLPIGVHCNLVAKYNLSSLADLIRKRKSLRVQGPYVEVVKQMEQEVLNVWPWADVFFKPKGETAIQMIEEVAVELRKMEGLGGAQYDGMSGKLAKAADLIKTL